MSKPKFQTVEDAERYLDLKREVERKKKDLSATRRRSSKFLVDRMLLRLRHIDD